MIVFELACTAAAPSISSRKIPGQARTLPTYTNRCVTSQYDREGGGTESGSASGRRGSVPAWQALHAHGVSRNFVVLNASL